MDTVLGVKYNGGVILAADQNNARSILLYQTNLDKVRELTTHSAMAVSGPSCDLMNFTEYISKNLQLYELANCGTKLSVQAQAHFARNELATALRKGPFQVNVLLGGYDVRSNQPALYFMDYLAALQEIPYGAQGYAQSFCLGIMDKEYKDKTEHMTEDDAMKIMDHCIHEIHVRFLLSQPNFIIKAIDKDGVRIVRQGADPADC